MRRPALLIMVVILMTVLVSTTTVFADQVYHTERLDIALTADGEAADHPELRKGQVVNIHPNGPVNGAIERYMINGAMPNTSYQIELQLFAEDCDGAFQFPIPTVALDTNKHGNASASAVFSAEALIPFSGQSFGVVWHLVDPDLVVAYATDCTVVTID